MSALQIEIVSDPVCPWCYIGKRRLEQALARHPEVQARVRWAPYQLSPDMPPEGRDRSEHYTAIFGEERARLIQESMAETARGEGLTFTSKAGARSPNTLAAHLLLAFAQREGADGSVVAEALFKAHHVDCEDLGDRQVLQRIAVEAGLDADACGAYLEDPEQAQQVRRQMEQLAGRGISGVPCFIFNERYAVSGAQPADAFADLIGRLTA